MNKILIATLLLLSINMTSFSQGIVFNESSWAEVLTKAKTENKLIMLDAYASWCKPCKIMARETFANKKVGDFYNDKFICVKMDMEKGDGPKLSKEIGVKAYPSIFYINGDGQVIYKRMGYMDPDKFIKKGKKALKKFNKAKKKTKTSKDI